MRLQLENFDFLHFAQVEIFGIIGINGSVGRCSRVVCGKQCTVAIVRPLPDPMDINRVYRRAVLADARNADILRQRETFALEYDRYGRGDAVLPCIICTGGQKCETCVMKDRFGDELKDLPLGAAGRTLTLDEMATMLLDAPKPPLNFTPKEKVDKSFGGMLKRRLAGKSKAKKSPDDDASSAAASAASKKEDKAKKKRRGSAKVAVDDAGDGDDAGDADADAAADDGDAPGGGGVAAPDRPDTTGPGDARFAWRFNYRHS